MNSLIADTVWEHHVKEFKSKQSRFDPEEPLFRKGWWVGFIERNKDVLETKKGQKFANNRSMHTTYDAFVTIYSLTPPISIMDLWAMYCMLIFLVQFLHIYCTQVSLPES